MRDVYCEQRRSDLWLEQRLHHRGRGVGQPVRDPTLFSTQVTFVPTPTNFSFDCLGRPRDMGTSTGICGNTLAVLAVNQVVQISNADPITIWRETGYVR